MFSDDFYAAGSAAKNKYAFLKKNPAGYFIASMLAGMFIGFGVYISFIAGGLLSDGGSSAAKLIMGATFGAGLSIVIMAGAELFTGNNFVMGAGALTGQVTWANAVYLWIICYLGNLAGSVIAGCLFALTGLASGPVGQFMAASAAAKMSLPFLPLLVRAILCNILVCLAIWCTFRCKSEGAKLTMVFWCLLVFVTAGFEHSVANMTLMTIGLLSPMGEAVSIGGFFYNLAVATLGNVIGGLIFTAFPYYLIARRKEA